MSAFQAEVLSIKLSNIEQDINYKNRIVKVYRSELGDDCWLTSPIQDQRLSHHLLVYLCKSENERNKLQNVLQNKFIETGFIIRHHGVIQ